MGQKGLSLYVPEGAPLQAILGEIHLPWNASHLRLTLGKEENKFS